MDYDVFADWQINTFCNFRCVYCHQRGQERGQDAKKIIDGFNNTGLKWWIRISGGEPLFHPEFVALCKGLNRHLISVNTNLSANNVSAFAQEVEPEQVASIQCALHIDERERLHLVRDFIGKFQLLQEHHAYVSQVMYPPVLARFDDIYRTFEAEGIQIRPKVFVGTCQNKRYPKSYTEEDKEKILAYTPSGKDKLFLERGLSFKGRQCEAGQKMVYIKYDGTVLRCQGEKDKLGNLFNGGMSLLTESKRCSTKICPCPYHGLRFAGEDKSLISQLRHFVHNKCGAGTR